MQNSDILMTFAELALALAGFTGIVAALGHRAEGLTPAQLYRATSLISIACGAMLAAVLPIVVQALGASTTTALRAASATMAVHAVAWFTYIIPTSKRVEQSLELHRRFGPVPRKKIGDDQVSAPRSQGQRAWILSGDIDVTQHAPCGEVDDRDPVIL